MQNHCQLLGNFQFVQSKETKGGFTIQRHKIIIISNFAQLVHVLFTKQKFDPRIITNNDFFLNFSGLKVFLVNETTHGAKTHSKSTERHT